MAKYHIPIDTVPDCFAHIGELATRWGWIENQTGVLIRELLRLTRPEGHMAIGNMGIQPKTRVLAALAEHLFKEKRLATDLVKLADAIQKYDTFRNDVIHGLWVYYPKNTKKLALLRRKNLQQQVDPFPDNGIVTELPSRIENLKKLQNEAQRLTDAIKSLHRKF